VCGRGGLFFCWAPLKGKEKGAMRVFFFTPRRRKEQKTKKSKFSFWKEEE
jgi:hypothetical protein